MKQHSSPIQSSALSYTMQFTRNKYLIRKYRLLREELCRNDEKLKGYRIMANYMDDCEDPDTQMLIIHNGNNVYGGAQIRISTPKKPVIFYLEQDVLPQEGQSYFSLKKRFLSLN